MNEVMDFLESKKKKYLTIVLICAFAFAVGIALLISLTEKDNLDSPLFGVCLLAIDAGFILGLVFLGLYISVSSHIKWIRNNGFENAVTDIRLDAPTYPKSKLYCGRNAVYVKSLRKIIPYSKIAWTYMIVQKTYGITVGKSILIYTDEGKKFTLQADVTEYQAFLESYVGPVKPDIIIGFGINQKKKYNELRKKVKAQSKSRV